MPLLFVPIARGTANVLIDQKILRRPERFSGITARKLSWRIDVAMKIGSTLVYERALVQRVSDDGPATWRDAFQEISVGVKLIELHATGIENP